MTLPAGSPTSCARSGSPRSPAVTKEVAIGEQEARAEVAAAVVARQGDVDLLDILQARADEPAAGDRGGRIVIVVGARIGEVDQAVLREAGVQRHVEQPALAIVPHLGHARDRLGHEPAVRDDAEPAGALRHQHPPVGQEGEAPGVLQPVHHLDQMETVLGALERAEPLGRRERAGRAEGTAAIASNAQTAPMVRTPLPRAFGMPCVPPRCVEPITAR